MTKRISSDEARAHFTDVLGSVFSTKEPIIVERNGKPLAVMISPEQYETMRQEIDRAWRSIETVQQRNADKDADEVLRDITEAVEAVRQERYAKSKKTSQGRR
ncbi:MAG: type II toxin-antitoxin system Phd/YefM family antitoxin [Chloroflexi bacterium]|nr:type II toxin-antitoxin system Phd/YefM family antitoxin [Chloroflexota bacterium]